MSLASSSAGHGQQKGSLHQAVTRNDVRMVVQLLADGASPCEKNAEGRTALHLAASSRDRLCLAILLQHIERSSPYDEAGTRATVTSACNLADEQKETPLHAAARAGNALGLQVLLSKGADPNARNFRSEAPLHLAAKGRKESCVEALVLDSRIEKKPEDAFGKTPRDYLFDSETQTIRGDVALEIEGMLSNGLEPDPELDAEEKRQVDDIFAYAAQALLKWLPKDSSGAGPAVKKSGSLPPQSKKASNPFDAIGDADL